MTNPAQKIIEAGFALRVVDGDRIAVTPVAGIPIDDKLRSYVKENRAAILANLTQPAMPCVATKRAQDVPAPLVEATTPPAAARAPDAAYWPWELHDLVEVRQ